MKHRAMALAWVLLACGCSGLSREVPDGVFRNMSVDKKMRLFDAENDVSIAEDERDQMRARARELREDRQAAKRQRSSATDVEGDDREAQKLGKLAEKMWDKRVDYLDDSIDYLHDRISVQGTIILVAKAKFELAKALLVKKNKLEGAEDINPKDFERQVEAMTQRSKSELAELDKTKPKLVRSRQEWLKLRDEVAASSLSSLGSPGEDEIPVWESW